MNKFLTIILLFSASSCYAIELHNAIVLEHQSGISGGDDMGHPVDGHLEENGKEKPVLKLQKKSTVKNIKQQQLKEKIN